MRGSTQTVIEVENVRRSFGEVVALDGVDLRAAQGRVLGLLGPNGAGKTTLVRILTTLLRPDSGSARVLGHDVVADAGPLRSRIGLAGPYAAVDEMLTGFENLELVGRLYHLSRDEARRRAGETLERFDLSEAGNRPAKTYSGGMRRRLDLAASLVGKPQVLFLDEPTTGLDIRSRLALWEMIEELVRDGTTLLLTTQYLEEADQLADHIVVIDRGSVIASGTSEALKTQLGADVLDVHIDDVGQMDDAIAAVVKNRDEAHVDPQMGHISVPVRDGSAALVNVVRRLDDAGIAIKDIALRRPTLDDVFLALTGESAEDVATDVVANVGRRRSRARS